MREEKKNKAWKTVTVSEAAQLVGAEVYGNGETRFSGIYPLASAEAGQLTFFSPTTKRNKAELFHLATTTKASAILVAKYEEKISATQLVVGNPFKALAILVESLYNSAPKTIGIHPTAQISASAKLGNDVSVGAYAVIGENVVIGDGTIIHPHVVVYAGAVIGNQVIVHSGAAIREYVEIGDKCVIQNGAIIGGDGFGYVPDAEQIHRHVRQVGTVILEQRVDIGANSTIDRATFGETRINRSTKIDNLVQIGHNTRIGEGSLLCGMVGVSGSVTIGKNVVLAGQVGVADHVKIGDRVRAAAKTGITGDIEGDRDIAGFPPQDAKVFLKTSAIIRRLPELLRQGRLTRSSNGKLGDDDA